MFKKIILGTLATLTALGGVLVWHIAAVTSGPRHLGHQQMAVLATAGPLDSALSAELRSAVKAVPGVSHVFANAEEGRFSFAFDNRNQDKKTVLASVVTSTGIPCSLVEIPAEAVSGSCPISDHDSWTARASRTMAGWFQ